MYAPSSRLLALLVFLSFLLIPIAGAQDIIVIREGLAARSMRSERSTVYLDPVAHALASGSSVNAIAGKPFLADTSLWQPVTAEPSGYFTSRLLRGGYLYATVDMPRATTMILEASGHSMVWINGTPRAGDVYDYGYVRHPVALKKGTNELVFSVGRGRVRAQFSRPRQPLSLITLDPTLPDLVSGDASRQWGAVRVLNATGRERGDLVVRARVEGHNAIETVAGVIGPMTSRKIGFQLAGSAASDSARLVVVLLGRQGKHLAAIDSVSFALGVVRPDARRKQTFVSGIDGSVQYYSIVPGGSDPGRKPALFLSLHGASVEATNQARAYKPKSWGHVAAATNRRPYGFDWEDWGRMDALEVLADATRRLGTDTLRTYLTGHSMGGHGTWITGATYPDKFAAIAPSCGWYEWWSYGLRPRPESPTAVETAALRALNPVYTTALMPNYASLGIFVLHGQADETVPVQQARTMRSRLGAFHTNFAYYEVPGAGHWWSDEAVDYPGIFDFFRRMERRTAAEVDTVQFITASPGISSRAWWATVARQDTVLALSKIDIRRDSTRTVYTGTTQNVALLGIDTGKRPAGETLKFRLDDQELSVASAASEQPTIWLERQNGTWKVGAAPAPSSRNPERYGGFKDGFRNQMIFVYSTKGTPEENRLSYEKARYDAEAFYYRGNGSIDVIADADFDPAAEPDRGVILYGNAETNRAWQALLGDSPVQVSRKEVRIGEKRLTGDNLSALFVRPRPGSKTAAVSVVAGTGTPGVRATFPNPYFMAGTGYPDVFVYSADMLVRGEAGVKAWGYFDNDWTMTRSDFLFQP